MTGTVFSVMSLPLDRLKKNKHIVDHILWDFEPSHLMRSSIRARADGTLPPPPRSGYILYIETMEKHPALFLMIQNASGYAETFAKIDDVPQHLLEEAVQQNREKEYCKMYPIHEALRDWLKQALGISR